MITDWQIQRRGDKVLLGLAVHEAVLDILTDEATLASCLSFLKQPHDGHVDTPIGSFGDCSIRLNIHHDESVSIFIDGPTFDPTRSQSAAIWVEKDELISLITTVLAGSGQ